MLLQGELITKDNGKRRNSKLELIASGKALTLSSERQDKGLLRGRGRITISTFKNRLTESARNRTINNFALA